MDGYNLQVAGQVSEPLKPQKVSRRKPSKSSRLKQIQFSGDLHNDLYG
jgi:hypothetical protein